MLILSKNENSIVNMDYIAVIYIGNDHKSIKADYENRNGCELAKYDDIRQCKYALGSLLSAAEEEREIFIFPKEIDLAVASQHRSHVKTKSNRHGGS